MDRWGLCRRILIIRADNMGDVLMSLPAIRALREQFKANISLLTSKNGAEVAELIPEIDEVLEFDVPWIKTDVLNENSSLTTLVALLKRGNFDGCIIFTVYSQNPLPAAMLAYAAEIPLRLAYCRENPYGLLTDWVPDQEPLTLIRHQVERDLYLVSSIGAFPSSKDISLPIKPLAFATAEKKLKGIGLDSETGFFILHPGVSELKRYFPKSAWINFAQQLFERFGIPLLLTGTAEELPFLIALKSEIGAGAYVAGGLFNLEEFAAAIAKAKLVISVNTGTGHLAAAVKTPIVVLYAQTNPQHHPWMVPSVVLEYSIPAAQKSKNQLINFVDQKIYGEEKPIPTSDVIINAVASLLVTPLPRPVPADKMG
jgi:ADP-heptose:LPS heptosyltransferase